MKVEMISFTMMKGKINIMTSSGITEHKVAKKEQGWVEFLGFLEKYLEENQMEISNPIIDQISIGFLLTSK